jgi:DNA-binding NtrC family response regulator
MVEMGAFRRDLYHRCNGQVVHLRPLRERAGEWPTILRRAVYDALMTAFGAEHEGEVTLTAGAVGLLRSRPLSGNFRELQRLLISAIVAAEDDGGPVRAEHVESAIKLRSPWDDAHGVAQAVGDPSRYVAPSNPAEEREAIVGALRRTGGVKARAAEELGMSRSTFYRKLARHRVT